MVAAASGKIIEFLHAVARNESSFNGLDISGDKWEAFYWGEKRNREWLKERFRRGGDHGSVRLVALLIEILQ